MAFPNIAFLLVDSPLSPDALRTGAASNMDCTMMSCYYASDQPAANFYSLFSSTMPTHHGCWTPEDKPLLHAPSVIPTLTKNGYEPRFAGPVNWVPLANAAGFMDTDAVESTSEVQRVVDDLGTKSNRPAVLAVVINSWTESIVQAILEAMDKDDLKIVAVVSIGGSESYLASPCFLISASAKGKMKKVAPDCSIVDLTPSLLGSIGIKKKPYSFIGKDMHDAWTGREPKHGVRQAFLIEHATGSKTLVTEGSKLTIDLDAKNCSLFDLKKDRDDANNLWNDPECEQLKQSMLLRLLWAQLDKESVPMPRVADA
jgi:hypothetical protein